MAPFNAALIWVIFLVSTATGCAEDDTDLTPDESLRAFLRLVIKNPYPESYGFSSVEEAGRARLGKNYAVWSIQAWHEFVKANGGKGSHEPSLAEDQIYEVLGDDGGVKCVMAFCLKDGKHQPMSLSVRSADVLSHLQTFKNRTGIVLVIDGEGLKWVDAREPLVLNAFPLGVGARPSDPRGGFLPGSGRDN
jgi:hypothetical protein